MSAAAPDIFSFDGARAVLEAPDACERFAALTGSPVFVVDAALDGPHEVARWTQAQRDALVARLQQLPCVSVLLQPPAADPVPAAVREGFDLALAQPTELDAISLRVRARPLASLVLVQLLRGGGRRSIEEGLVAESLAYSTLQAGPEFAAWRASKAPRAGVPAAEASPPLRVAREGATLYIELDRPARHNAFSRELRDALCEALELACADAKIERVVWSGRGPSFCSGGDLDEFGQHPDPATAHAVRITRSPARLIAALSQRLEVRVHGACIGAGVELPAFAHRVVAAQDARFALPELTMGLVPGAGGTVSLPRRIGRQATARLALGGATLSAEDALALGLVDEISGTSQAQARHAKEDA